MPMSYAMDNDSTFVMTDDPEPLAGLAPVPPEPRSEIVAPPTNRRLFHDDGDAPLPSAAAAAAVVTTPQPSRNNGPKPSTSPQLVDLRTPAVKTEPAVAEPAAAEARAVARPLASLRRVLAAEKRLAKAAAKAKADPVVPPKASEEDAEDSAGTASTKRARNTSPDRRPGIRIYPSTLDYPIASFPDSNNEDEEEKDDEKDEGEEEPAKAPVLTRRQQLQLLPESRKDKAKRKAEEEDQEEDAEQDESDLDKGAGRRKGGGKGKRAKASGSTEGAKPKAKAKAKAKAKGKSMPKGKAKSKAKKIDQAPKVTAEPESAPDAEAQASEASASEAPAHEAPSREAPAHEAPSRPAAGASEALVAAAARPVSRPVDLTADEVMDLLQGDEQKMFIVMDQLEAQKGVEQHGAITKREELPVYKHWNLSVYWTRNNIGLIRKNPCPPHPHVAIMAHGGFNNLAVAAASIKHLVSRLGISALSMCLPQT